MYFSVETKNRYYKKISKYIRSKEYPKKENRQFYWLVKIDIIMKVIRKEMKVVYFHTIDNFSATN